MRFFLKFIFFSNTEPILHISLPINRQHLLCLADCQPYVKVPLLTGWRIYPCCLPLVKESEMFLCKAVCLNIHQHLRLRPPPVSRELSAGNGRILRVRRILIFPLRLLFIMDIARQATGLTFPLPSHITTPRYAGQTRVFPSVPVFNLD